MWRTQSGRQLHMFRFHHFEESVASHLKAKGMLFCNLCKLTFYYFTGVDAAAPVPANDDDLSLCQCNSCMARPLLAERGLIWKVRWSVFTSMLRIESTDLAHCAKRCKRFWCQRESHHRPPASCWRQRGSGDISLERRIKGFNKYLGEGMEGWCSWRIGLGMFQCLF